MHAVIEWLKHPWYGAPVWLWLVAFVGLPIVNEVVQRLKLTKAQSILQAAARALLVPFGRVPVLGDVLRIFAAEPKPEKPKDPPVSGATLLLVLSAIGLAVAGSGCADPLLACDKSSITVATSTAKGYKALDIADEWKQGKLREQARVDAAAAEAAFVEWKEQRGVALKVFDAALATVEGYAAARAEIAQAIDKKKAAAPWIEALAKAAGTTAAKLAELEVIPGGGAR